MSDNWIVIMPKKILRICSKFPATVRTQIDILFMEIKSNGPVRGNWKNYSKLGKDQHHCHIKSGRPTYVCCWKSNPELKIVEIYYVGTHENAPY